MPAESSEPNNDILSITFMDLEELSAIDNHADHILDIVRLARIIRNNVIEFLIHAQWIIADRHERSIFHIILRQIAKHFADEIKRVPFTIRGDMTYAGFLRMDTCTT